MKSIVRPLLIALSLIAPTVTLASVTYTFDFTDLDNSNPTPDFSLTLTYPEFVTTTGMMDIVGNPLPTTLGYSVVRAGTNSLGWWGFGAAGGGLLTDSGFGYVGQSFLFQPFSSTTSYLTTPGAFEGGVMGVEGSLIGVGPSDFSGNATLTITETGVPEPPVVWLLSVGLVALVVSQHRNLKARNRMFASRSE